MYRFGAALFYANASRFCDEILRLVGPSPTTVRWVIIDGEAITNLDFSAARAVEELKKNLTAMGVQFGFARLPWNTRADFDRHYLTKALGSEWIFNRLHDAVDAFEAPGQASSVPLA
jgi:MFS superfamily sulfate permease-like transporter